MVPNGKGVDIRVAGLPGQDIFAGMFVIELTYKADLKDIDKHMPAHVAFLKKYYATGNFLVSGRKIPRDGGIILAVADSRRQVEEIAEEDPFCARGLADFRIVEFRASQQADDIQVRIARQSPPSPSTTSQRLRPKGK